MDFNALIVYGEIEWTSILRSMQSNLQGQLYYKVSVVFSMYVLPSISA